MSQTLLWQPFTIFSSILSSSSKPLVDAGLSKPDSEPANFFSSLDSAREKFNTDAEWAFGNLRAVVKLAVDFCCCRRREEKEKGGGGSSSVNDDQAVDAKGTPTGNGNRPSGSWLRFAEDDDELRPRQTFRPPAPAPPATPPPPPPLAQAKPLVEPDAPFTESSFLFKGHLRHKWSYNSPTGALLKAVNDFIGKTENANAKDLFNNFRPNNSNTKDLIIYQYEMARKQIDRMDEGEVNLSESQIKLLNECYPKEVIVGKIDDGKKFLQDKLGRITTGLSDNIKPIVIEDKIIRLNNAIAIIDGRQTKPMTPATYCGLHSFTLRKYSSSQANVL